jgi:hypothetical protein
VNIVVSDNSPEENELDKKKEELEKLKQELLDKEVELVTLKTNLSAFLQEYYAEIGYLLIELDELKATLSEQLLNQDVENQFPERRKEAKKYRAKADASAEEGRRIAQDKKQRVKPTEDIKELYREVAKLFHPDLATDKEDNESRGKYMRALNLAFESGDIEKMRKLKSDWGNSPEMISGEGIAVDLIRIIRIIANVKSQLVEVQTEIQGTIESETYSLFMKFESAEKKNINMFNIMKNRLNIEIREWQQKLNLARK